MVKQVEQPMPLTMYAGQVNEDSNKAQNGKRKEQVVNDPFECKTVLILVEKCS